MARLLRVLLAIIILVPTGLVLFLSHVARASDAVALVTCELLSSGGPTTRSVQIGTVGDDGRSIATTGVTAGGSFASSRVTVSGASGTGISGIATSEDIEGRSCAEVQAELAAGGFVLAAFQVGGRNRELGFWTWTQTTTE